MVLKSITERNNTGAWAVFDVLGNELIRGTLTETQAYYDANKEKIIEDTFEVNGNLVNDKREEITDLKIATGWKDLKAKFSVASQGASAPSIADLPNGIRIRQFGVNDSMHVEFHVDHDLILAQEAFPHFHVFSDTDIQIGETIIWEFIYVNAKGYTQGGNLLGARTTITLTYTADAIITAGDHIIIEGSESIESLDLLEPDTMFLCETKFIGGTLTGVMYGISADIHYLSDHETTIGKRPIFTEPDL